MKKFFAAIILAIVALSISAEDVDAKRWNERYESDYEPQYGDSICRYCRGSGQCRNCDGYGYYFDYDEEEDVPCYDCDTSGECSYCEGKGYY